jgi:hypothetical protein
MAGGCNWNGTVFNTSTLVEDVGCLVLPVSGLELNVSRKGDKVMVNWSTSSERNTSHFLVENSIDGSNWNNAGRVEAKGNSQIKTEYSFQFKPAGQGKSFFRLRQVDKDGKFVYSQVKTLPAVKISSFSVSPNPVSDRLNISVPGMLRMKKVSLINAQGKVVFELSCLCSGTTVDMNKLSPGVYIVRLTMEDGDVHIKRVVRN